MGTGRAQKFGLLVVFATKIIDALGKSLSFVRRRKNLLLFHSPEILNQLQQFRYHGRPPSAAPATGSIHRFLWEQEEYLSSLFGSKPNVTKPGHGNPNEQKQNVEQSKGSESTDNKNKTEIGALSKEKPSVPKDSDSFFDF